MRAEKDMRGLLKNKFDHYEADPGIDLWSNIEAEIRPQKKGWGIWTPYLTVAASILILLSMFMLLNQNPNDTANYAGDTPQPEVKNEPELVYAEVDAFPTEAEQKEKTSSTNELMKPVKKPVQNRRPVTYANAAEAPITMPEYLSEVPEEKPVRSNNLNLAPLKGKVARESLVVKAHASSEDLTPASASSKVVLAGTKNSLDIDNLSVASAIDFAGKELNKWANSPINIYKKENEQGEVRTFQIKLLDLQITQKTHRKNQKSQRL